LLLVAGGHVLMLKAVAMSFVALPLGAPVALDQGFLALVKAASSIFATGLQFAAPVIAAILLANTALAILGRAAPQLQIISIAFPLQIGIGLLTFASSLGLIANGLGTWTAAYGRTVDTFARAVQVAPEPAGRR
ncbi:MAG: flagellar biosynthetic protein FliR, partial [Gemmatimonas sp.]